MQPLKKPRLRKRRIGPILVVSGGAGISGEQVARTVLAQFPDADLPVIVVPHVKAKAEIRDAVKRAAGSQATIVHTLVDGALRQELLRVARAKNVVAIDLMGSLLTHMTRSLGQTPLGQPGLYRKLRQAYFDRIDAIEFTVAHDDGKRPEDLEQAEIVLVGPSRVGKTPLSVYLSTLGWRVANLPLVRGIPVPEELSKVDPRRIVGIILEPGQLLAHRRRRQMRLGAGLSSYSDAAALGEEIEEAKLFLRSRRYPALDVTDKPIEESAEEVVALIGRRLAQA